MTTSSTQWYVRTKNGASGPYSTQQIKDFANNGKLPRQSSIGKSQDGPWSVAEKARGLFPDVSSEESNVDADDDIRASDFVPNVVKSSATAFTSAVTGLTKSIVSKINAYDSGAEARYTQSLLTELAEEKAVRALPQTLPPGLENEQQPMGTRPCPFCTAEVPTQAMKCRYCGEFIDGRSSQTQVTQNNLAPQQHVHIQNRVPKWNAGVAAVLSFLLPGLGQLYKTQIFNGIAWFFAVLVGYMCFIFPGLVLHLFCVIDAASGDPYE